MNTTEMSDRVVRASAAKRLAENEAMYQQLRATLQIELDRLGTPDADSPKQVLTQIKQLTLLSMHVSDAEDVLHEKLGTADASAIDYDAIRADIGGRLDRIRAALVASGFSECVDG